MGWLMKIKFPVILWTLCPGLGPYVRCDTSDHTSSLETIRSLQGFQGEPYFFSLILLFSKSIPKTIKGFLRSPKLK
jgi:hypothetical protein